MEIIEIFTRANSENNRILNVSYEQNKEIVAKITQQISAYKHRSDDLTNGLTNEIVYDLFHSLKFALNGTYRYSFISSRCSIELGIALMKFKDDNFSYLLWQKNKEDISWSTLTNSENGVLSTLYFNLFRDRTNSDVLITRTLILYRNCSEYVHGKYSFISEIGDQKILENPEVARKALEVCFETVKILNTLLLIRFGNKADEWYSLFEKLEKEFEL